jgi:type I restriction enzyme, S subunit
MMDKQINKIPLVRFPEFKEGWEHKQLNELLSVSKTKNLNLIYSKEDVLSVSGESGIVNQIEHLGRSYAGVSVHNYSVVEVGQIVYTKSPLKANPYGIIKLNNHKAGIVSTLYAVYFVNEKTDGQFIEHYFSLDANLNRYLRPLVRKGAKNDMKISNEYVLNDRIFSPQLKEQKKIASFLTSVDKKINLLTKKKALLETYKKGVIQKIFSQEIRFKDEDGNDFPNWEEKRLGDIGETINGLTYSPSDITDDGVLVLRSSNVQESRLAFEDSVFVNVELYNPVKENDILICVRNGSKRLIGKNALVTDSVEGSAFGAFMSIYRSNYNSFLFYWFNSNYYKKVVYKNLGATINSINNSDLKKFKIPFPSNKEQQKIASFLSSIDKKIELVDFQLERNKEFKKGLLQQMFV